MTHSNLPETVPPSKRTWRRLISGCALIILLPILFIVYWFFIRDVEAKENKLQFATPVPQAQVYIVTKDDSLLKFTIIERINGTIDISGENFILKPTTDGKWQLEANLQMDGQSTKTAQGEFWDFLLKVGLKADEHPYGRFIATSTETFDDSTAFPEQPVTLVGQLEISGIVNDFTINATISLQDSVLTVNATPTIDLKDFGVSFPEQIGSSEMATEITVMGHLAESTGSTEATPADSTN